MKKASIIVIDTSAALRQQVSFVLSPQGYEVFESDSLRGGIKKIQEEPVCLVIVGNTLPDFSMPFLLRKLHSREKDRVVPFILLRSETGHPGLDDIASTSTPGSDLVHPHPACCSILEQPFSSISLLSIVKKVLRECGEKPHTVESSV